MSYYKNCQKKAVTGKKLREIQHANNRMKDRFGKVLTQKVQDYIIWQIKNSGSVMLEKQSNRVTLHLVALPDARLVRVVYDKNRSTIVTVFKPRGSDYKLAKNISTPKK